MRMYRLPPESPPSEKWMADSPQALCRATIPAALPAFREIAELVAATAVSCALPVHNVNNARTSDDRRLPSN